MKHRVLFLLTALLMIVSVTAYPHEMMDHSAVTPIEKLTPAADPKFPVGAQVVLQADHMPGMQGAVGRISGAFDTVLYMIDYTRRDNGEMVTDHKWVIHEELANHGASPFAVGDTATLLPGHISGMGGEGAQAVIKEALPGVAYMVDFLPTDGSEPVVHHQWLSESELALISDPLVHQGGEMPDMH